MIYFLVLGKAENAQKKMCKGKNYNKEKLNIKNIKNIKAYKIIIKSLIINLLFLIKS
jgi:hypothetical protein